MQEKPNSTAIEPSLAALLMKEHRAYQELPLAIRRFVERQEADGIVRAALGVTQHLLQDYQRVVGPLGSTVRLSKLAQMQSVVLRGLSNVALSREVNPAVRQRYRAVITMSDDASVITIPPGSDRAGARISVAHELGHLSIHSRGKKVDQSTIRLGSSEEEEGLAEYIGRLLLLPKRIDPAEIPPGGMARACFDLATAADVPLSAALARIGDPDQDLGVAGVILWELRPDRRLSVAERLKPYYRLCGSAFIPDRSHAREGSLSAMVGSGEAERTALGNETVRIGRFVGDFKVEAHGWGSEGRGTRKVLSTFQVQA